MNDRQQQMIYDRLLCRVAGDDPPRDERIRAELSSCGCRWKAFWADAQLFRDLLDVDRKLEELLKEAMPAIMTRRGLINDIHERFGRSPRGVLGWYRRGVALDALGPGEHRALAECDRCSRSPLTTLREIEELEPAGSPGAQ